MTDSPIERYLDQLFIQLRANPPRDARSLLAETEAHLRDAAEEAQRNGLERTEAERAAVEGFGDPHRLAFTDRDRTRTALVIRIAVSAWWLGAIGAVAVGVSGVIAGLMRLVGASTTFIAGTRSTANLPAADCSRWLAGDPHAHSCAQAALSDWTWEVIVYRIALGVLGALALAALAMARRRSMRLRMWSPLPDAVVDTIGATVFGIAGVWLTGLGIDAVIVGGARGAGFWLSAAPVALAAGVIFGYRFVHDLDPTT